jgi:hypothetical protein
MKLTNNNDYILVELSTGMDYWEVLETISELFSMPESKNKNDIWAIRSGQIQMSFTDLYEIKDLGIKICPNYFKSNKTAIIVENGVQQSLAAWYADICKELPREIRVFSDFNSAKDWIIT